tara:strand:- start:9307 stop:9696 length:390 start_codon:yes stop_codon:yes gene_type:complete
MVGQSHRVQIRHVVVANKEIAITILDIVETAKTHSKKTKALIKLAEKYSLCGSKNDGGNLGWLELASDDPRKIEYQPVFKNTELEKIVRESIYHKKLHKNKVFGPVKTLQGFHIIMIGNEFGELLHETF